MYHDINYSTSGWVEKCCHDTTCIRLASHYFKSAEPVRCIFPLWKFHIIREVLIKIDINLSSHILCAWKLHLNSVSMRHMSSSFLHRSKFVPIIQHIKPSQMDCVTCLRLTNSRFCIIWARMKHFDARLVVSITKNRHQRTQDDKLLKVFWRKQNGDWNSTFFFFEMSLIQRHSKFWFLQVRRNLWILNKSKYYK